MCEIFTIRFPNFNRIRIRIIFGFEKSPEYEYEYYSVFKNHPNTNTNIIRFENIFRIRIRISLFGLNYSNIIRIPNYSLTSETTDKACNWEEVEGSSLYHDDDDDDDDDADNLEDLVMITSSIL